MPALICKLCAATVPADARFCPKCGKVLHPAASQNSHTEKRILTLVFADLVGSTALAQASGLEGYDAVMQTFHQNALEIVTAYGGVIVQSYGDGIFATFGLHRDGEDAALAALAAGLALAREVPNRLSGNQLRIGIHTGQVLCRLGETGEVMPQVTGFDVNLTARIQENATIGSVSVSATTYNFLRRLTRLSVTDRKTVSLKGVTDPIDVFQIEGYNFAPYPTQSTSLFERKKPLETIVQSSGHHLVFGPAGIGKSTFLESLTQAAPAETMIVALYARSNLTRSPFVPLINWLSAQIGDGTLPDVTSRWHLSLSAVELGHIQSLLTPTVPPPQAAEISPAQVRTRQIAAMTALMAGLLQQGAWLLFDDFHWTDDNTREVVTGLINQSDLGAAKIVLFARPYPEVMTFANTAGLRQTELLPLSKEASFGVLNSTTGRPLTPSQREDIITRAVGNPLYLVSLAESASSDKTPLPATMASTLQAFVKQFDGLGSLVSAAAVIGRFFTKAHLRLLMEDGRGLSDQLAYLELRGLMRVESDGATFMHPLYRETAYDMMTAGLKRDLHKKFAQLVLAHDPAFCQSYPELVADHAIASNDNDLIVPTCLTAGAAFLRRANFDLAIQYFTTAVTALRSQAPHTQGQRSSYLTALSYMASSQVQKYGFAHDLVLESYQQLDDESQQTGGDDLVMMMALYGLFAHRMVSGRVNECLPLLDRMSHAQAPDIGATGVLKLVNDCAYGLYSGRFQYAVQSACALSEIYDVDQHGQIFLDIGADPLLSVLSAQTQIAFSRGQHDLGRAHMAHALDHLDNIGATIQRPWLDIIAGTSLFFAGFEDEAHAKVEAGIAMADDQGAAFWQLAGRLWQSVYFALGDRAQEGRAGLEAMIPAAERAGIGLCLPTYNAALAQACLTLDDLPAARTASQKSVAQLVRFQEGLYAPMAYRIHAKTLCDDPQQAAQAIAQADRYRALAMDTSQNGQTGPKLHI